MEEPFNFNSTFKELNTQYIAPNFLKQDQISTKNLPSASNQVALYRSPQSLVSQKQPDSEIDQPLKTLVNQKRPIFELDDNEKIQLPITVIKDLTRLKRVFGVYHLQNKDNLEPDSWIANVKNYLINNYAEPNAILKYFFMFLNEEYHTWFFKLSLEKKSDLNTFSCEFLEQSKLMLIDQHSFALSFQKVFNQKIKKLYEADNTKLSVINSHPLYSYFKHKLYYLSLAYKSLSKKDMLIMSINMLDDNEDKKKMLEYKDLDVNYFLIYIRNLDDLKST